MRVEIRIVNMVATVTLGHHLDLLSIVRALPETKYNPERFPGLVFRLKKPRTAMLIFSTGRMVCTGGKSESIVKRSVSMVIRRLKTSGILILSKPEIKIVNIVASVSLGGKIDVEKTAFALQRVMYEPEQFPGLIYRMDDPKVVILIYTNGKLVIVGAKEESEIEAAVDKLKTDLEEKGLIFY